MAVPALVARPVVAAERSYSCRCCGAPVAVTRFAFCDYCRRCQDANCSPGRCRCDEPSDLGLGVEPRGGN